MLQTIKKCHNNLRESIDGYAIRWGNIAKTERKEVRQSKDTGLCDSGQFSTCKAHTFIRVKYVQSAYLRPR